MTQDRKLVVLLGCDYSGKSTALTSIGTASSYAVASYDDAFLPAEDAFIARARRDIDHVMRSHSPELLLAYLHVAVAYVQERVDHGLVAGNVIVDSYYCKILAKCVLKGLDSAMFEARWRARRPDAVIFLRVPPTVTWERSLATGGPNPLETEGDVRSYADFCRFQTKLAEAMLDEVKGLPVREIDGAGTASAVAEQLRAELTRLDARSGIDARPARQG